MLNLLRLHTACGFRIDDPLPSLPVFDLIAERGGVDETEMIEVFNMGCGFCVVVPAAHAQRALELIAPHHEGAAVIGSTTADEGTVELTRRRLGGPPGAGALRRKK